MKFVLIALLAVVVFLAIVNVILTIYQKVVGKKIEKEASESDDNNSIS